MEKIHKREIQRLFPILEAIKEGKTIQWNDMGMWRDIDGDDEGFFLDTLVGETDNYRIKPNPKYRPFANAKECWEEMQKHQPFGVTGSKHGYNYGAFKSLCDDGCDFFGYENETFESAFNDILFADGVPFGVKVEE